MKRGHGSMGQRILAGVLGAAALLLLAVPATAQHRARLSQDLADELKAPTRQTLQVIVDGDAATLRQVAARYGLRVKRQLDAGLVLEGSAEAFDAAANDAALDPRRVDHPVHGRHGGHARVHRRAWPSPAASQRLPGFTGEGIRIAVIDSGVDITHPPWPAGCSWRRTSRAARPPTRSSTASGTARTWPT